MKRWGWGTGLALLLCALLGNCITAPHAPTAEEKVRLLEITACVVRAGCANDKTCFAEAVEACASAPVETNAGAGGA